jgi:hypothetical protein
MDYGRAAAARQSLPVGYLAGDTTRPWLKVNSGPSVRYLAVSAADVERRQPTAGPLRMSSGSVGSRSAVSFQNIVHPV